MASTIQSMTGYAGHGGEYNNFKWQIECKSLNAKGLDIRIRVPGGFDFIENMIRTKITNLFLRGNITCSITLEQIRQETKLSVNHDLLREIMDIAKTIEGDGFPPQSLTSILSVRGVIDVSDGGVFDEDTKQQLGGLLLSGLDTALEKLQAEREGEGETLRSVIAGHLQSMARLQADVMCCADVQTTQIRDRIQKSIAEFLQGQERLSDERLHQETAVLLMKADVREEADRLKAHIEKGMALLAEGGAVGKKLDFLCQELNREANTLCSKASTIELTNIGMDIKTAIDQMREQVQNIA